MNFVLLGAPGAGKGTQAEIMKARLNLEHLSTGDILRAEMKAGSELGKKAKQFVESGSLVPDDLIISMIKAKLQDLDSSKNGFILDGFPRTVAQSEALDKMLGELDMKIDYVLYFDVDWEVVKERLLGRRVCRQCGAIYHIKNKPPKVEGRCDICGGELYQRKDDTEEVIKNRFEVYKEQTAPVVDFYKTKGILKAIDSNVSAEDTYRQIEELLKNR